MGMEVEAWAVGLIMGGVAAAKIIAAHPKLIDTINEMPKPKEKSKPIDLKKLEGKAALMPEFKMPDTSELDKKIEKSL